MVPKEGFMLKMILDKIKNGEMAKNSLIALFLKVVGIGLLFALSLFLTNNFSADLVGQYGFARSVLLILGGFSVVGTEQSVIYYTGYLKSKNAVSNIKDIYFKSLKLIFCSCLILLFGIFLINEDFINSSFEVNNPFALIKMVIINLFLYSVMMLNIGVFRALDNITLSETYRNVLMYILYFGMAYLLLFNHLEKWIVEAYLVSYAILGLTSSVQIYFLFKKLGKINPAFKITTQKVFKISYPMALNTMTFFILQSVGVILLGKFDSFETVAFYDTAVRVASLTALGTMSVSIAIAPKLAEDYSKNDFKELAKTYQSAIKMMTVLSIPALIILLIFPGFVLGLFGSEYKSAKTALYILVIAQFLTTFMGGAGTYMNMTGKQKILHRILIFACVLNIALNYWLIPVMGMNGSALAAGISMVGWNILATVYIYKKDGISIFNRKNKNRFE